MERLFYVTIDEVQRSYFWHELVQSDTIAADGTDHFDGRKRYALPDACLRPLGLRLEGDSPLPETAYTRRMSHESEYSYNVEANWIITDADSVNVVYLKRNDDPSKWTSELLDCIYYATAAKCAKLITQDAATIQFVHEMYQTIVNPQARTLQAKYKTDETLQERGFWAFKANRGWSV